ncbi:MAG: nucleoside triphosphate pyrophosphohydrolase, partial [Candidatus Sericytochromatia bacterium]|nr:nucleoside triphosphate pyrophosphohydrolase [Candidatus Tanganyikabacteria bacterium]
QVWSRQLASDAKLSLMRWYGDDHPVTVLRGAGIPGQEQIETVPLFEVDRLAWIDHLTSFYLPPGGRRGVRRLEAIMHRLRTPGGCPWDAEQTHQSLRRYCLEEAYEVVDAIDRNDDDALEEELGDLLLQVVFHSELAAEDGRFDLHEVADRICDKLIARHPHVFGSDERLNAEDHLKRWEDLKAKEKHRGQGALAGVPLALPALTASEKLQSRAARVGFEWPDWTGARAKLAEELTELDEALATDKPEQIAHEIGDLLTAVVNIARFKKIDPEQALRDASARFQARFGIMESLSGGSVEGKSVDELLGLWARAKATTTAAATTCKLPTDSVSDQE